MRTNLPEVYCLESLTQSVYVYSVSQTQVKCHVAQATWHCFISLIWTRWLHVTWQQYRHLLVSTYLMTRRRFTSSKYKENQFYDDSLHRFMENFSR